jgi:hypothetical protein
VRSLERHEVIRATPDKAGRFVLENMLAGPYSFEFPFPGRFVSVLLGGRPVVLPNFDFKADDVGLLEIVVSLKDSAVTVDIAGLPEQHGTIAAVLCPQDPHLTLRYSCYVNSVGGARTEFRYVPPGAYRVFIVDQFLQGDVAAYAPRFPEFLNTRSPEMVVGGAAPTFVKSGYIDASSVQEAVRLAGPLPR